jgi:SAM-dependent methyltransferase
VTPEDLAVWRASTLGALVDRLEHDAVQALAGDLHGRDLLDVGCGDGAWAVEAARAGARVVAVDLDPAMVEATRRRAADVGVHLETRVADALALPFDAGSFDQVWLITVLCLVRDPEAAVAEAARVLRPDGVLLLGELGAWSTWAAGRRLRGWLGASTWKGARFWTPRQLRRLVRGAGLAPTGLRAAVHAPRSVRWTRRIAPVDPWLGRVSSGAGAAFLALRATRSVPR